MLLRVFLEAGEYKSALDIIADPANDTMIKVQTMDLIALIAGNLSDDNAEKKPDLYSTSETLLNRLAQKCTPQEVLFELIEKLGAAPSDEVFTSLLKVAQVAILRLPAKNARCIEWVFTTVMEYLDRIPLPEAVDKDMEEQEEILLENDEAIRRLLQLYLTLQLFLEPIAKHLGQPGVNIFFDASLTQKNALICFVLMLMGKLFPLLHLQRTEQPRKMNRRRPLPASKSYSIQVAEDMAGLILLLVKDPLYLLSYGEKRTIFGRNRNINAVRRRDQYDDDEENSSGNDCFLNNEKYKAEGLAMLYYLLLGEELLPASAPQVYEPRYILEMGLYYVVQLLSSERTLVYFKGIRLTQSLLKRLIGIQLTPRDLDAQIHSTFCERFIRALERSGSVRNREVGLSVLTQYIYAFDDEGRYTIIAYMLKKFDDDSVRSFAISCYKNLVCDAIRHKEPETPLSRWYTGEVLKEMLTKHVCVLKHGVKTDLLDNSYSITSALAALWVLLKTDQANRSHIWDYFDSLEKHFLQALRTALDLSRAHYQNELKATVDGNDQQSSLEPTSEISVCTLNGELPPVLTKDKKIELCKQMLLRLDMLDFNLARLNERKEQEYAKQQQQQADATSSTGSPTEAFASSSSGEKEPIDPDVERTKEMILDAALAFVQSHGWSKQAIAAGAEAANYPSVSHGLFPRGGIELVHHFYKQCNLKLIDYLKQQTVDVEKVPNPSEFARKAIEFRLRLLEPYLKYWPQALGLMTLPPNAPHSLANMLTLVDDICYYAGDRSVDFNWYTRRIGLACIYKTTELYMLQDSSAGFEKTWKFLERRMEEASLVHEFLVKSEGATHQLQNAVGSAFTTARNILGLNFDRR
uniref:Uncharacterized protein n=1 Tax=Anopheles atroparvus TaxID=41427 RepID=A0A182JGZ1_ANOAO